MDSLYLLGVQNLGVLETWTEKVQQPIWKTTCNYFRVKMSAQRYRKECMLFRNTNSICTISVGLAFSFIILFNIKAAKRRLIQLCIRRNYIFHTRCIKRKMYELREGNWQEENQTWTLENDQTVVVSVELLLKLKRPLYIWKWESGQAKRTIHSLTWNRKLASDYTKPEWRALCFFPP